MEKVIRNEVILINPVQTGINADISKKVALRTIEKLWALNIPSVHILEICNKYHGNPKNEEYYTANEKLTAVKNFTGKEKIDFLLNFCVDESEVEPQSISRRGHFVEYNPSNQTRAKADELYLAVNKFFSENPLYLIGKKAYSYDEVNSSRELLRADSDTVYNVNGNLQADGMHLRLVNKLKEFKNDLSMLLMGKIDNGISRINVQRIMNNCESTIKEYKQGRTTKRLSVLIVDVVKKEAGELKFMWQIEELGKKYGLGSTLYIRDGGHYIPALTYGLGYPNNITEGKILGSEKGIDAHANAAVTYLSESLGLRPGMETAQKIAYSIPSGKGNSQNEKEPTYNTDYLI